MLRVLMIDDEPFYYKMLLPGFKKAGYTLEYARTGGEGLLKLSAFNPDVIILDVRLPDLTGFDIIQRLRSHPVYSSVPVIFISGQNELNDKLKAFDLGADDYMEKPFQTEELIARLGILARRGKAIQIVQQSETFIEPAMTIALHSLRGGLGCSSLAVNLSLAFYQIWKKPTLLMDAVLAAGQMAMMLDASPAVSWEDFTDIPANSIDDDMLRQMACVHNSGIRFVASPRYPVAVDNFKSGFFQMVMQRYLEQYDYIVIDTAHDFSDITIEMLSAANIVLLVIAPEMASIRAALCALNIYQKLGFAENKVKLLLNNNSNLVGIKTPQIEKVLGQTIDIVVPYSPNEVNRALNVGEPFVIKNTDAPITVQLEEIAYQLSKEVHKSFPPVAPTSSWKRVTRRQTEKK
jgi:pilus assembly protein CpaE